MAGSMKDIKLRIKSVESTMQITKAMELVASSKMRRAKERVEHSRPYFETLHETLTGIAAADPRARSPYLRRDEIRRTLLIVIAGDRGLAGGYNSNMFKTVEAAMEDRDCVVLPIGKKAVEHFRRKGIPCITEKYAEIEDVSVANCFEMANMLCKEFKEKGFGHIELCYTRFVSMLSQQPDVISMLPLSELARTEEKKEPVRNLILYEPSAEEVFDAIVPEYLAGLIYGGVCEAQASELAARRMAMEAATGNAEEMIENLNLFYNRARQASITQEITEIVGGAEGI